MKILIGLCALLFAGHSMATCTVATYQGSYTANGIGKLLVAGDFVTIASANLHGDGTAQAQFTYSLSGIIATSSQNLTYTVIPVPDGSGNCQITATAMFAGIPVSFTGYGGPSGDKATNMATLIGTTIYGTLERTH